MPNKELSIIIPCYNCSDTLEEAVNSCFTQGLKDFEIILVDDGSKDNTKEVMNRLAQLHPEITLFYHDKNKGGGATRNTAVEHSTAPIIFCLDSDDILPDGTLSKMLAYLHEKNADGVGIEKSIKFKGKNKDDVERVDTFGFVGERIPKESLIQTKVLNPLYSTFMHTKESFQKAGGYPTTHGFDTQGFAWRFLMNDLVAYGCPGATYLHRLPTKPSYYMREYNAGRLNLNWQAVLSEFLDEFSPEAQQLIAHSDTADHEVSLIEELKKIAKPWRDPSQPKTTPPHIKLKKPIARNSMKGIYARAEKRIRKYTDIIGRILNSRSWQPDLIIAFIALKIAKKLKIGFISSTAKETTIDIVVPTVSKDFPLLAQMIDAMKVNLSHKINKIYIVSRAQDEMNQFCEKNGYIFIDEKSVVGYGKDAITYMAQGLDRSGWIFQQLLKLSGEKFIEMENYVIVDSDTILIQPHAFIEKGRFVFLQNEEWQTPYFASFKKIFGYKATNRLSYTSHMMIFNTKCLKAMKAEMEKKHAMSWDRVYLTTIDPNEPSCISDYDTYGNWMRINRPELSSFVPFYNKSMSRSNLLPLAKLTEQYRDRFKSLSFHHYTS